MKTPTETTFETLIVEHLVAHGGYTLGTPDDLRDLFLSAWTKAVEQRGVLDVLRHGLKFYGKLVKLAVFAPAHGLDPDVPAQYDANRLVVARRLRFDPTAPGLELDLALFVNGIPVVTAELKHPMTGQTVRHAKHQYRTDRSPDAPVFRFKRGAVVHFAVDTDLVEMTTRPRKDKTFFLPFNRGHGTAAGNAPAPGKHRTAYLWEQVWQRDSLRDAVRKLVAAARQSGPGRNYPVQHPAGSGKSNSIAWLAHRLSSLHDAANQRVYDAVIVPTDRRVLDRQLQDTIYQFDHKAGVVEQIDKHSSQLADALTSGTPIINRGHRRALPVVDAAQDRRQGQGDGGHRRTPPRRPAQARLRQVHRREGPPGRPCSGDVLRRGRRQGRAWRPDLHRGRHEQRDRREGWPAAGFRSEGELPERFASDVFQVLLVANKYQTGFDEPRLHTMYVDKRLHGIQAVQTLSLLNRTCPGKEDTFVRDFVNEREEILASFQDDDEAAKANTKADFGIKARQTLQEAFVDRHQSNGSIVERFFSDETFKATGEEWFVARSCERLRADPDGGPGVTP